LAQIGLKCGHEDHCYCFTCYDKSKTEFDQDEIMAYMPCGTCKKLYALQEYPLLKMVDREEAIEFMTLKTLN
jgi:predicted metal-binding protein